MEKKKKKRNRRESDQGEAAAAAAGLLADGQKCGAPLFAGWMSRVGGDAITAAIITQISLPAVPLPAA